MSGRVQGVGFRAFCVRAARSLELDGWVRNLPDGRVEVVAAGRAPDLDRLADTLRQGPAYARVDVVEEETIDGAVDRASGFDVRFGP